MSCTISISKSSQDIWMIRNSIFHWYVALVANRFTDDKEVVSQVELAEAMNGISLDEMFKQDPRLAIRLQLAFRTVADEIVRGEHAFPSADNDELLQNREQLMASFTRLSALLTAWKHDEVK